MLVVPLIYKLWSRVIAVQRVDSVGSTPNIEMPP